jgi:formylglycine-generating enzyme required for sulfatase activity
VNWLNTSNGHSPAYNFTSGGANDNITLWGVGDAGYDPANPFRNSNAYYFLPSEDEWYKAAYYDPNANGGTGGYWDYATGSNSAPTAVPGGTSGAVYGQFFATGPALVTDAGGLSPYGTMAQNGNVWERGESGFTAPNDSAGESRVVRGGSWGNNSFYLQSSDRGFTSPSFEIGLIGFRVAAVPEPSGVLMTLLGAIGFLVKRKRS